MVHLVLASLGKCQIATLLDWLGRREWFGVLCRS